jgi:hypothetical protein
LCKINFMFFKKTIILAWLSSLLVSTAGVSVHRVYCFCKNESAVMFFIQPADDCEKKPAETKNCCKSAPKTANCCTKIVEKSTKKHGCTDRSTKFAKLDVKFLGCEFLPQLIDSPVVTPVSIPFFCEIKAVCPLKISNSGNVSPPTRLAGRVLLIFIENFRC